MCDEGFHNLAKAIILQAIKDFKPAYRRLKAHPDDKPATARVKEITEFFCGEYFCLLTDVDGPRLLKKVIAMIDEEMEHEKK